MWASSRLGHLGEPAAAAVMGAVQVPPMSGALRDGHHGLRPGRLPAAPGRPGSVTPTEINCFGPPHKQDDGAWPVAVSPLNVLRRFGVTTFASRYRTVRPSGGIANAHQTLSRYAGMKKWLSRGDRREVSRVIAAPADVLYAMVSDLSRMGEWSPENVGGGWRRGSGPTVGGRFKGRNARGLARWTTNVEVTAAESGRLFEFVVHLIRPLITCQLGLPFEPRTVFDAGDAVPPGSRPTWWVWVGSKQLLRISDPDTHYVTVMEATLEALANAVPA